MSLWTESVSVDRTKTRHSGVEHLLNALGALRSGELSALVVFHDLLSDPLDQLGGVIALAGQPDVDRHGGQVGLAGGKGAALSARTSSWPSSPRTAEIGIRTPCSLTLAMNSGSSPASSRTLVSSLGSGQELFVTFAASLLRYVANG